MNAADTIVALSTVASIAPRAIVRMSGDDAFTTLGRLTNLDPIKGATMRPIALDLDLGMPVPATLYAFRLPRSATGEHVVELHVSGSSFVTRRLLDALVTAGARPAEPGEFTARAFFNGKLDLSSAEGVAATIGASNRAELDAARSLLAGELARRLKPLLTSLVDLLATVEADVDFADEDVSLLPRDVIGARIDAGATDLQRLLATSPRLERLSHEPRIVLVGRPNAGKSTLLNHLAGHTRAVVSATAGTTRDALSAGVTLASGTVTLIDVAGIDAERQDDADDRPAADEIERQMSSVAWDEIARADHIIYVTEFGDRRSSLNVGREPSLFVTSKSDLCDRTKFPEFLISFATQVSVHSDDGIDALRDSLNRLAFPDATRDASTSLAINARHVREIESALTALADAHSGVDHGIEFVASALRRAVDALGRILGSVSPDDVLGRIFSSFCIGK